MLRSLAALSLALISPQGFAQCPNHDLLEDNDDCSQAVPVSSGWYTDLTTHSDHAGQTPDSDYYSISVDPGEALRVEVHTPGIVTKHKVRIYDALNTSCGSMVYPDWISSPDWMDGSAIACAWRNESPMMVDCIIEVESVDYGALCSEYDMFVDVYIDPCQLLADDPFEDNDACAMAALLPAGLHQGVRLTDTDPDYFEIALQPDEHVFIDLTFDPDDGIIELEAFRQQACSAEFTVVGSWSEGHYRAYYYNQDDQATSIWLHAYLIYGQCTDYSLSITVEPNPCTLGLDDVYETGLGCDSPVVLSPGFYPDLYVEEGDSDWFLFTVDAKEMITVSLDYEHIVNVNQFINIHKSLALADCSTYPSDVTGSVNALQWTNRGEVAVDVVIRVWISQNDCSRYDMTVTTEPDPCLIHSLEDPLDDNDDCATATRIPVTGAAHQGLFLTKLDPDFYTFTVPAGGRVWIDALFDELAHDIDLTLYDESATTSALCGGVGQQGQLHHAQPNDDGKWLTWPNTSPSEQTYYLHVKSDSNGINSFCGTYDLIVKFDFTSGPIGTRVCVGDGTPVPCGCLNHVQSDTGEGCKNSTSVGAKIEFTGSAVLFDNDVTAHLLQAPPGESAMLLQGSTLITLPFRDGLLCVGGWTYRLETVAIDGHGAASSSVPLRYAGDLNPGHDRIYQWWYRDPNFSPCGTGSNLSSGMRVQWL